MKRLGKLCCVGHATPYTPVGGEATRGSLPLALWGTEAIAIHWHKDTHRFSKTIVTAPTADQLTGQLWGEVSKLHRRQKERWPIIANEWDILSSSIAHRNPDFADWHVIARTARAERPEGLQGAHGQDADDEFGDLARLFGEERTVSASGMDCSPLRLWDAKSAGPLLLRFGP